MKHAKNTIFLWDDEDVEEAARFYAKIFPDSSVEAVHKARRGTFLRVKEDKWQRLSKNTEIES